jgi:chromosome partitioning protein
VYDGSLVGSLLKSVMRNTIAVMNTKGGVGKSTLVLAIAETLSARFGKNVLVVDADAQASVSLMLMSAGNLHRLQADGATIVDLLVADVLKKVHVDWQRFVIAGVSDVQEARSVYLIPSDMQLTLFEREVSQEEALIQLRASISELLGQLRAPFDIVLIDCPPGLSVVTESWLREADFYISPVVPDHLSIYALEVLSYFKGRNPEMGFAESLGVLINMRDMRSAPAAGHERRLRDNAGNRCFAQTVPRTETLQHAVQLSTMERPYDVKYPGEAGAALRAVCEEFLDRIAAGNGAARSVGAG